MVILLILISKKKNSLLTVTNNSVDVGGGDSISADDYYNKSYIDQKLKELEGKIPDMSQYGLYSAYMFDVNNSKMQYLESTGQYVPDKKVVQIPKEYVRFPIIIFTEKNTYRIIAKRNSTTQYSIYVNGQVTATITVDRNNNSPAGSIANELNGFRAAWHVGDYVDNGRFDFDFPKDSTIYWKALV